MPSFSSFVALASVAASALADIHPVALPSGFFSGPQSGVGSWYRASADSDSTNGKSWCAYTYYNSDPLFAVSLKAMGGATYSSNPTAWKQQTQKYCGLEAKVTDPSTGKTMLMYIGDAFDDTWVITPASIDIMIDGFSTLHGNPNGNKNIVINPVKWELTGNVNTKYAAAGALWPTVGVTSKASTTTLMTTASLQAPSSTLKTTTSSQPPSSTSTTCAGCLGARCDGQTTVCNSGLTCLSPNGICSNAACNWGCTGWTCSSTSPCQKPNTCVSSVCRA